MGGLVVREPEGDKTEQMDPGNYQGVCYRYWDLGTHHQDYFFEGKHVVGDSHRVLITWEFPDERIEIVITDTGSGIADEILEKIFEPLFSTKTFGVGLGMPTIQQIMQQHGGGVEINSTQGKGTSVNLWLQANIK